MNTLATRCATFVVAAVVIVAVPRPLCSQSIEQQLPPGLTPPPQGPPLDLSHFSGHWKAESGFFAVGGAKPRIVEVLRLETTPTEITIDRGNDFVQTFKINGSSVDLGEDQAGSVLLVGDGLVLITKRTRDLGSRGMWTYVITEFLRVQGDTLRLQVYRTQTRGDGTLAKLDNALLPEIVYRRMR